MAAERKSNEVRQLEDEVLRARLPLSDVDLDFLNRLEHRRRMRLYRQWKNNSAWHNRIVSEGDSWFLHPNEWEMWDYMTWRPYQYLIYSLGGAGHTLAQMLGQNEFPAAIAREQAELFLLSGGGNDLVDAFPTLLNQWTGDINLVVNQTNLANLTTQISDMIEEAFRRVQQASAGLPMIYHGYDYGDPGNAYLGIIEFGLGKVLAAKGVPKTEWRNVMRIIIDYVNVEIAKLDQRYPKLHYLDLRGTVNADEWMDELHADQRAWDKLSAKFHAKMQQVLPPDVELA